MVLSSTKKDPVTVDFVLVVEATANMVAHWDTLKKAYIHPAIKYFNGRPPSALDYIGNHGSSQFAYVLFHSADQAPELLTKCSRAMQSPWDFVRSLDEISFTGGGSERSSLASEGLAKALQLFDDLAQRRGPSNLSKKICFLVCNSPPYDMPCLESFTYNGKSVEQLAELMGSKGIHLSIIAPQRIKALQQLYLCANQKKPPTMNYAQDPRHLVYISGFPLPTEHDPVKLNQGNEQKQQNQQAINNNIPSTISTASLPSPAQHQSPASNPAFNHNTPISAAPSPGNLQVSNSGLTLPGQTDTISGIGNGNSLQNINGISASQDKLTTTVQVSNGQVTGFAPNNMSATAPLMQTSLQSQMPQTNQQQSMNFPNMTNNNPTNAQNRIGSPFSRAAMSTGNVSGIMTISKADNNIASNSNIKDLLQHNTSQPQILLSGHSNQNLGGMSGQSNVPGTNSQGLFNDTQSMLQNQGMQGQQQMTQNRMPPQSVGQHSNLPTSITTVPNAMQNVNMQQVPPYSNSQSVMSQGGQNNVVSYGNQLNTQQMSMGNNNVNPSTFTGSAAPSLLQNDMGRMQNSQGMNQVFMATSSASNPSGAMMQNTQPNNQMQKQPMLQPSMTGHQPQGAMTKMGNPSMNIRPQTTNNYMNANQPMPGGQPSKASFQSAQEVANSVMAEAQRLAVGQNNPRAVNPNIRPGVNPGMGTQVFPTPLQQQPVQAETDGGRMVWNGTLEWTEKRKMAPGANPARTTRTLNCQVFVGATQADDGWMNAGAWPNKLTMQLIPHMVFQSAMQNQVRNNRSVTLRMSPADLVNQLANIMKNKWMGLVQIPSPNQNAAENSYKVMLVIYSQKKGQFFGLLPLDPHSFISTIRQVIQRHQQPRPNPAPVQQPPQQQQHPGMNVDAGGMLTFQQDGINRTQQQNTNQPGQFINQIIPRPTNTPMNTMQQQQPLSQMGQQGGIRVGMNPGMSVQQTSNQQMNMDPYRQQQQQQQQQGQQRLSNNVQMQQNQNAMMGQQQIQQNNMGQQQMQPAGNQQYIFSNLNQQTTMVPKQGMGQIDQLQRLRLQQQQQQQQQQQRQRQNQQQITGNNMQMNQMTTPRGMGDHDQLRSLLQSNGNSMATQRPRMLNQVNQAMMGQGMRQTPQGGMRPGFTQSQQVRHLSVPGTRMMGMQQQQQRF